MIVTWRQRCICLANPYGLAGRSQHCFITHAAALKIPRHDRNEYFTTIYRTLQQIITISVINIKMFTNY